jgi:hypothetical protein
MVSMSLRQLIEQFSIPALIMGGSAAVSTYLEHKERPGLSVMVKVAGVVIFVLLWLLPMLDRLSWMFRGVLSIG